MATGVLGALVCFKMVGVVRDKWKIDDTLGVFAVHGVGAAFGALLLPFLAVSGRGGMGIEASHNGVQFGLQKLAILVAAAWAAGLTYLIIKATARLTHGMRVDDEDETVGLDIATHGERAYDYM